MIGVHAHSALADQPDHFGQGSRDITIAGLCITRGLRWPDNGPGSKQAPKADGSTPSDLEVYFTNTPNTIAYLPLDEDASVVCPDRAVKVLGGAAVDYAGNHLLWLSSQHASDHYPVGGDEIHGVAIGTSGPNEGRVGAAVYLGAALYFRATDSAFMGGNHGVAGLGSPANYTWTFDNDKARGFDAAMNLDYADTRIEDLSVGMAGRTVLRVRDGICQVKGMWVEGNGEPETIITATSGARVDLERVHVDFEGGPFPSVAVFSADTGANDPSGLGGRFTLRTLEMGTFDPGCPIFLLKDTGKLGRRAEFAASGLRYCTRPSAVVQSEGDCWQGTLNGVLPFTVGANRARPVEHVGEGKAGVVVQP